MKKDNLLPGRHSNTLITEKIRMREINDDVCVCVPHLFLRDVDALPENCPDDNFVAGWGGEGTFVAEKVICVVR